MTKKQSKAMPKFRIKVKNSQYTVEYLVKICFFINKWKPYILYHVTNDIVWYDSINDAIEGAKRVLKSDLQSSIVMPNFYR